MDYRSQIARFLHRRVCVEAWGRSTVWGTLVSIHEDHFRLADTVILGELEGQGWFEQMQYSQPDSIGGPRNAETILRFDVVLHVTCTDDDLPEPFIESKNDGAAAAECSPQPPEEPPIRVKPRSLEIEVGRALIPMASLNQGTNLLSRISRVRKEVAEEMGVVFPRVRIKDCLQMNDTDYRIRINGHVIEQGTLVVDCLLAMHVDDLAALGDRPVVFEPAYGLPAKWVDPEQRDQLIQQGGSIVEPAEVLITHFLRVVRSRLHEVLGYQNVLRLIDDLREDHGAAMDDLIPEQITISSLHRLLRLLLEEQVPILHLMAIIESAAYHSLQTSDLFSLLQRVRVDIGRDVCAPHLNETGQLSAVRLESHIEQAFASGLESREATTACDELLELVKSLQLNQGKIVILVRNSEARRAVFVSVSAQDGRIAVIAEKEVPRDVQCIDLPRS